MNIEVLANYITVCDSGSINKAARLLHISQPPLSRQIQNLENELGSKLFDRSNSGIKLTPEGKILYERAKSIIALSDLISREIRICTHIIRFGMTTSSVNYVGNILSENIIPEQVSFDIVEENTYELIDRLMSDTIDFAFIRTPFTLPDSFRSVELYKDEMVLVGHPKFFEGIDSEDKISPEWLTGKPLIINRRWKDYIVFPAEDGENQRPHYKYLCDDNRTAYTFAHNGLGVAIIPSSELVSMSESLTMHEFTNDLYKTSICLVYKEHNDFDETTREVLKQLSRKEVKDNEL